MPRSPIVRYSSPYTALVYKAYTASWAYSLQIGSEHYTSAHWTHKGAKRKCRKMAREVGPAGFCYTSHGFTIEPDPDQYEPEYGRSCYGEI